MVQTLQQLFDQYLMRQLINESARRFISLATDRMHVVAFCVRWWYDVTGGDAVAADGDDRRHDAATLHVRTPARVAQPFTVDIYPTSSPANSPTSTLPRPRLHQIFDVFPSAITYATAST
jgi:hypothetical protein